MAAPGPTILNGYGHAWLAEALAADPTWAAAQRVVILAAHAYWCHCIKYREETEPEKRTWLHQALLEAVADLVNVLQDVAARRYSARLQEADVMAERAQQPTLTITEGRVADILAWIIERQAEINTAPAGEIIIGWGGGKQPQARLIRVETIPPVAREIIPM